MCLYPRNPLGGSIYNVVPFLNILCKSERMFVYMYENKSMDWYTPKY